MGAGRGGGKTALWGGVPLPFWGPRGAAARPRAPHSHVPSPRNATRRAVGAHSAPARPPKTELTYQETNSPLQPNEAQGRAGEGREARACVWPGDVLLEVDSPCACGVSLRELTGGGGHEGGPEETVVVARTSPWARSAPRGALRRAGRQRRVQGAWWAAAGCNPLPGVDSAPAHC